MKNIFKLMTLVIAYFVLGIFIQTNSFSQELCSVESLAQIDDQLYQTGKAMGSGLISVDRGMQISRGLVAEKEKCTRLPSINSSPNSQSCAMKREKFNRCRREFNKKIASGLHPRYSCVNPEC